MSMKVYCNIVMYVSLVFRQEYARHGSFKISSESYLYSQGVVTCSSPSLDMSISHTCNSLPLSKTEIVSRFL